MPDASKFASLFGAGLAAAAGYWLELGTAGTALLTVAGTALGEQIERRWSNHVERYELRSKFELEELREKLATRRFDRGVRAFPGEPLPPHLGEQDHA